MTASQLLPLCCNLRPRVFKYGEYLVKQGEVPPGLMLLVQGQCKVVRDAVVASVARNRKQTDHPYSREILQNVEELRRLNTA